MRLKPGMLRATTGHDEINDGLSGDRAAAIDHVSERAGPSGWTDFRRAKMMIRWAAL